MRSFHSEKNNVRLCNFSFGLFIMVFGLGGIKLLIIYFKSFFLFIAHQMGHNKVKYERKKPFQIEDAR